MQQDPQQEPQPQQEEPQPQQGQEPQQPEPPPPQQQQQQEQEEGEEWRLDHDWVRRTIRRSLIANGAVTGHVEAMVLGWLPASESDYVAEATGQPAPLWRVKYLSGALTGDCEDLEEHEMRQSLPPGEDHAAAAAAGAGAGAAPAGEAEAPAPSAAQQTAAAAAAAVAELRAAEPPYAAPSTAEAQGEARASWPGLRICKRFGEGYYSGRVNKHEAGAGPEGEDLWHVTYEDGDEEDLNEAEMRELLSKTQAHAVDDAAQTDAKRASVAAKRAAKRAAKLAAKPRRELVGAAAEAADAQAADAQAAADAAATAAVVACEAEQGGARRVALPEQLGLGERVEARYKGSGRFFNGTVWAFNADGGVGVLFDDGDWDERVPRKNMRGPCEAVAVAAQRWSGIEAKVHVAEEALRAEVAAEMAAEAEAKAKVEALAAASLATAQAEAAAAVAATGGGLLLASAGGGAFGGAASATAALLLPAVAVRFAGGPGRTWDMTRTLLPDDEPAADTLDEACVGAAKKTAAEASCALCGQGDCASEAVGALLPKPVVLARSADGAVKQSAWVHRSCAVHSAEVLRDWSGDLANVAAAVKRGRLLKCTVCKQKGATIGCQVAKCKVNVHACCAPEGSKLAHDGPGMLCPRHAAGNELRVARWLPARRTAARGQRLVGRRVRVWWDGSARFLEADVLSYARRGRAYVLEYLDDDDYKCAERLPTAARWELLTEDDAERELPDGEEYESAEEQEDEKELEPAQLAAAAAAAAAPLAEALSAAFIPPPSAGAASTADERDWVQCDACQKWRKVRTSELFALDESAKWTCQLNKTDPARASCAAPEEDWSEKQWGSFPPPDPVDEEEVGVREARAHARCSFCAQPADKRLGELLPKPVVLSRDADGAVKQSAWVHRSCAVHSAEVVKDWAGGLVNVAAALKRGKKMSCVACKQKGATIGCQVAKCKANYHFGCIPEAADGPPCKLAADRAGFLCSRHAASHELPPEQSFWSNIDGEEPAAAGKAGAGGGGTRASRAEEKRAADRAAAGDLMEAKLTQRLWSLLTDPERWYRLRELDAAPRKGTGAYILLWVYRRWLDGFKGGQMGGEELAAMRDAALRRLWLRRLAASWQCGTMAPPADLVLPEPAACSDDGDDEDYDGEGGGRGKQQKSAKSYCKFLCTGCGGSYSTKHYLQLHMSNTCKGEVGRIRREEARAKREEKQQRLLAHQQAHSARGNDRMDVDEGGSGSGSDSENGSDSSGEDAPTAAAAAAAVQRRAGVSRSGRVLQSRLSVVDGQQVLRANEDRTNKRRTAIAKQAGAKPKGALTAYMLFMRDCTQKMAGGGGGGSGNGDIMRRVAGEWATMDAAARAPYQERAGLDKKRLARELGLYEARVAEATAAADAADAASTVSVVSYSNDGTVRGPRKKYERRKPVPGAPKTAAQLADQVRMAHNRAIGAASQTAANARARFMARHWDALRPFVHQQEPPEAVRAALEELRAPSGAASGAAADAADAASAGGGPSAAAGDEASEVQACMARLLDSVSADVPYDFGSELHPAPQITATLRDYQLGSLRWLASSYRNGVSAILADEMGLGKTLQTISFLAWLKFVAQVNGPHLVVVPLSVLAAWLAEFRRFCPAMRVVRLHSGDQAERERLRRELVSDVHAYDVVLTTYEMVKSPNVGRTLTSRIHWRYVVLDEGHILKNEKAEISIAMRKAHFQHALLLTGTPLQNNLHEMWSLLNLLFPDMFSSSAAFDKAFDLNTSSMDVDVLEKAHYLLKPFMLRRIKADVEKGLGPKLETKIYCSLAPMQKFWYRRLLLKDSKLLETAEAAEREGDGEDGEDGDDAGATGEWRRMKSLLMQMRKCCNHPYLFPSAEGLAGGDDNGAAGSDLIEASGKMRQLDRLLLKLKAAGHRVVLFSQFTSMLDIIDDYCVMRGFKYARLDGSTNRVQRMVSVNMFNAQDSDQFLFIMSTRAGGLGINLQTADTVILYDSDWNPQADVQAMARVHRIGQTKPVHIYRLVSQNTVEERVLARSEKKLFLDQMVVRSGVAAEKSEELEKLDRKQLLAMLTFGADAIFSAEEGAEMTDAEMDTLIDRTRTVEQKAEDAAAADEGGAAAATGLRGGQQQDALSFQPAAPAAPLRDDARTLEMMSAVKAAVAAAEEAKAAAAAKAAATAVAVTANGADGGGSGGAASADGGSMQDIAAEWALATGRTKRERTSRVMMVDGHQILRENNYSLEDGEPSVHSRELVQRNETERSSGVGGATGGGRQVAGRDFDHFSFCLSCWDGGDIVCCDLCPASFHASCLDAVPGRGARWSCPHHRCSECDKSAAAAGGLLFRCEVCPNTRCEDCLPDGYKLIGKSALFGETGYRQTGGCYMYCSEQCAEFGKNKAPGLAASFLEPDEDRSTLAKLPQDVQDGLRAAQAMYKAKWAREGAARLRDRDERSFADFARSAAQLEWQQHMRLSLALDDERSAHEEREGVKHDGVLAEQAGHKADADLEAQKRARAPPALGALVGATVSALGVVTAAAGYTYTVAAAAPPRDADAAASGAPDVPDAALLASHPDARIETSHQRVELVRGRSGFGLEMVPSDHGALAMPVIKGFSDNLDGAATRDAGCAVADRVVAINGQPMAGQPLHALRDTVFARPALVLTLARRQTRFTVPAKQLHAALPAEEAARIAPLVKAEGAALLAKAEAKRALQRKTQGAAGTDRARRRGAARRKRRAELSATWLADLKQRWAAHVADYRATPEAVAAAAADEAQEQAWFHEQRLPLAGLERFEQTAMGAHLGVLVDMATRLRDLHGAAESAPAAGAAAEAPDAMDADGGGGGGGGAAAAGRSDGRESPRDSAAPRRQGRQHDQACRGGRAQGVVRRQRPRPGAGGHAVPRDQAPPRVVAHARGARHR